MTVTDASVDAGDEKPSGVLDGLKTLLPFARDGRGSYLLASVLAVISTTCQLALFYVIYRCVLVVVSGDGQTASELYRLGLVALLLVVAEQGSLAFSLLVSHRAAFGTLERLRLRIGERLARVPLGFLNNRRSGEMQRTVVDDVEKIELFLAHAIPDVVAAVSVMTISSIWMFIVDWRLALATISVVFIALPIMSRGMQNSMSKMGEFTESMSRMNGSIVELVRGLPVIRLFNRTDSTFSETRSAVIDSANFQADWGREFLPTFSLFMVLLSANVLTIVPVGMWLWLTGRTDTQTVLFFFIVGVGFSAPILKMMEFLANLNHLGFGAKAILELDSAGQLEEKTEVLDLGPPRIEVRDVGFSHIGSDGEPRKVLSDCSFVAEPGTVTAFVGPSGAGKTTMAKLLCRFWDVNEGAISVGGHDVREFPFEQLMDQISFVFQETFLFDETVMANIRFGRPDATDEEVMAAAQAARAHDFVTAFPDGYETRLGERGARLSGGEAQRLTLARAFLKDSPILVLDEATAYADPENEAAIQDAIGELIEGRTVLMIAHRLSTVVGADQLLVFDRPDLGTGRIVERGSHAELVALGGLYAEMWAAFEAAESISLGDAVRGVDNV